jgi:hypothetical protein
MILFFLVVVTLFIFLEVRSSEYTKDAFALVTLVVGMIIGIFNDVFNDRLVPNVPVNNVPVNNAPDNDIYAALTEYNKNKDG